MECFIVKLCWRHYTRGRKERGNNTSREALVEALSTPFAERARELLLNTSSSLDELYEIYSTLPDDDERKDGIGERLLADAAGEPDGFILWQILLHLPRFSQRAARAILDCWGRISVQDQSAIDLRILSERFPQFRERAETLVPPSSMENLLERLQLDMDVPEE